MLVFIDESGCPGFKLIKGSTPIFVIGMIIFATYKEAEETSVLIADLRNKLKIKPEFKFSICCNAVREEFFNTVLKSQFKIRALVVDKYSIYSHQLRYDADCFYNYFLKSLLHYDNDILKNALIKIDGSGDKEFKKALASYLRKSIAEGKVKKFKFADSKSDNLVQLADMCVGAIARAHREGKKDSSKWLKYLYDKNVIDNIWPFR